MNSKKFYFDNIKIKLSAIFMATKQQKKISQGGGHQKVTSLLRGGHRKVTSGDKGGGGLKNLKMEVTSFMDGPFGGLQFVF